MENEIPQKYTFTSDEEAIKEWDLFVTPIREYFKIPVYKPKPATIDENGKVKWW